MGMRHEPLAAMMDRVALKLYCESRALMPLTLSVFLTRKYRVDTVVAMVVLPHWEVVSLLL